MRTTVCASPLWTDKILGGFLHSNSNPCSDIKRQNMSSDGDTVAVFDLDGTITRHDTYLRYLLGYLQHRPSRLFATLALPAELLRFGLGVVDNASLKARFLQAILAGNSRSELGVWTEAFLDTLCRYGLRPGALARIAQHRAQG